MIGDWIKFLFLRLQCLGINRYLLLDKVNIYWKCSIKINIKDNFAVLYLKSKKKWSPEPTLINGAFSEKPDE